MSVIRGFIIIHIYECVEHNNLSDIEFFVFTLSIDIQVDFLAGVRTLIGASSCRSTWNLCCLFWSNIVLCTV